MATRYVCRSRERRALVRDTRGRDGRPPLNGIDYLEVVSEDQRTLEVAFIHPLPGQTDGVPAAPALNDAHFAIEGGIRITGIRLRVGRAEGRVLTLEADRAGDSSRYTLRLVAGPTASVPPDGFDPRLADVEFSFKADCPTAFDCAPDDDCLPAEGEAPLIDYLAKDYASFRRLMLDRLAVVLPDWKERNPADVGIALVELFAYAADQLSYFQDAVATEAYLGTSRRRVSVRRHARLLDYRMHDGCNARAWVCVETDQEDLVLTPEGPAPDRRTRFLTRCVENTVINPADLTQVLSAQKPVVFEPLHEAMLCRAHNRISLYTWGAEECCLPRGATRATLRDREVDRLRLRAGDVLVFEERVNPQHPGIDPDPTHRHAVRLTRVDPEATLDAEDGHRRIPAAPHVDPLTGELYVEVEWSGGDALPFPLCASTRYEGAPLRDVSVACGNAVLVDHGLTHGGEPLEPVRGPLHAHARLQRPGVTQRVPFAPERDLTRPAAGSIRQDPRAALAAVELHERDGVEPWEPVPDLLDSHAFSSAFEVEVEEDGTAMVRFGDGRMGRQPAVAMEAVYRTGNGGEGNVGADVIVHVAVAGTPAITRVWNPLPAVGGTDPEPLEKVRLYAPEAFRSQERAVTAEDYAAIAQRHPDVQRAHATLRWTGSWHTMFITVDRRGGRPVDAEFEAELSAFVARYQLAGHDVEIEPPRFVPLDIVLFVCVERGHFAAAVKHALVQLFSASPLRDGGRGFFHADNFTFGQPLYLSQLVATAMRVPGVRSVEVKRFHRWGELPAGELDAGVIRTGRLEILRADTDPNAPENGRIEFLMGGGR